jgi:protein SCO1
MPEPVAVLDRAVAVAPEGRRYTRRQLVVSAAVALVPAALAPSGGRPARAEDHGRIRPPVPVPDIALIRQDGQITTLQELLRHRVSALQVMFTSCKATCPIQGAIFERVQKLLPDQAARGIQLVSLSVDPDRDTPDALARWLRRFQAGPGWIAAAPRLKDRERVRDLAGRGRTPTDDHSTQVQIINREAMLVWRTSDLPDAEEIAGLLRSV